MATTVNITQNPGTAFTWAGSGFSWNSADAGKSWAQQTTAAFSLDVGETLTVGESLGNSVSKPVSEAFAISEALVRLFGKGVAETVAFSEVLSHGFSLPKSEVLSLVEAASINSGKNFSESFTISESTPVWTIGLRPSEFIQISEEYYDEIAFYLSFTEFVAFSEAVGKTILTPHSESFSIAENSSRQYGLLPQETVAILEVLASSVLLPKSETISFADVCANLFALRPSETISLSEVETNAVSQSKSETVSFSEAWSREVTFFKVFAEALTVSESLTRAYGLNVLETLHVLDVMVRHANAVLADISVSTGYMTFDEFQAMVSADTPLGNSPWKVLNPGDFDFKTAVVGVFLGRQDGTYDVRAKKSIISVDVPDIVEMGSANVSATGWTTVTLTRGFHVVEEVVVSLLSGGTLAVPEIRQGYTTATSFQVRLLKSDSPTTQVSGRISFSAKGY